MAGLAAPIAPNHTPQVRSLRSRHTQPKQSPQVLDDYIYKTIFGVWGMEPSERIQLLPRVCNSQAFSRYAAAAGRSQEDEEEAAYGASFGGGFVG